MKRLLVWIIALSFVFVACTAPGNISKPGIYECSPTVEGPWPTYRMDTTDSETVARLGTGTDNILEFRDLNTGVFIVLTGDSKPTYNCILIEPIDVSEE